MRLGADLRLAATASLFLPVIEVHFLQEFNLLCLVFDIMLQDRIFD